ncbi:MAG: hydroxyacylglutathione hydrolase [Rhodothermales bacterium]|jgi:hydroxyacylglutathione hydrolase
MTIKSFVFNPFSTNCFICHEESEAVIVDPSCRSAAETSQVLNYVRENDLKVREMLLTHAHLDHIFGCRAVADALGIGLRVHRDEGPLLEAAQYQARMFGFDIEQPPEPEGFLVAGEQVQVGESRWDILFTPGHSPGSVSFYDADQRYVISGDVLFAGSIGRTDLMGASLPVLMRSIYQELLPLGDDVTVYSGHGPTTTIGRERMVNPFLRDEPGAPTS